LIVVGLGTQSLRLVTSPPNFEAGKKVPPPPSRESDSDDSYEISVLLGVIGAILVIIIAGMYSNFMNKQIKKRGWNFVLYFFSYLFFFIEFF